MPPIFFPGVLPLLDVTHCCKLSLYVISRKTNKSNLRKWQKTQFQARFWLIYSILRKLSNAADRREPLSVCLCLSVWCGKVQNKKHPSLSLSLSEQKIRRMCYKQQYIYETNGPTKLPWCLIRAPKIAERYNNCYPYSQALRIKRISSLEQQFFCPTKKMDESISKTWL